jgi:hypothetical protein
MIESDSFLDNTQISKVIDKEQTISCYPNIYEKIRLKCEIDIYNLTSIKPFNQIITELPIFLNFFIEISVRNVMKNSVSSKLYDK